MIKKLKNVVWLTELRQLYVFILVLFKEKRKIKITVNFMNSVVNIGMMVKKKWGLLITLLSFCLLIPGIYLPMLSINASVSVMGIEFELLNETRSILETVGTLYDKQYVLVASLILFFSIVIPVLKGVLLAISYWLGPTLSGAIQRSINLISKWSMADVFVVGIFVAFLSAQATGHFQAALHSGFYFFVAYCLSSLLALQLIQNELYVKNLASDKNKTLANKKSTTLGDKNMLSAVK